FTGYQVVVTAVSEAGRVIDAAGTAIDVSSDWAKFPRYGYLAHFDARLDAVGVVRALNDFHLNGLQFYDWQWKHHLPYHDGATWRDIANRPISRDTVERFIAAAHAHRMMAMNYNLYGGAFDGYPADGSGARLSMGLFAHPPPRGGYTLADQTSVTLPDGWATRHLYEMNNDDPGWQAYIFGREREVFAHFGFDGWHVDSLGTRGGFAASGAPVNLIDHYPEFLNAAKAALGKRIVFNNVDADGQEQVAARANVDFVYSELWNDTTYGSIATRAEQIRAIGRKALVFAAYVNRGRERGTFNEPAVRLADAVIFASGASHLELGDDVRMLHHEYFPDDASVLMTDSLRAAMRGYYDFLVAYENLLRDQTRPDPAPVDVAGVRTSPNGATGTVWVFRKRNPGHQVVHFINLTGNRSDAWRDEQGTCPRPPVLHSLAVRLHVDPDSAPGTLWVATPDENFGRPQRLSYVTGKDDTGPFIRFTLPRLEYWTMAWLDGASGSR
ncbi:MAG TPA: glycoside hydrolase family 66 protein, partial [Opitutaceae bacterium]|nr:glycoside hydrolase family 66 protein [Opitutaceae bacterium]